MTHQEIKALGFVLKQHVEDSLGNKHRLGLYPDNRPGGINYFDNLTQVRAFLRDVELIRAMQEGNETLIQRRKNAHYAKLGLYHLMEAT